VVAVVTLEDRCMTFDVQKTSHFEDKARPAMAQAGARAAAQ
jgi:hypothetical protein